MVGSVHRRPCTFGQVGRPLADFDARAVPLVAAEWAPGTLTPMPDDEPRPNRSDDDGPVFTGYGIGSAVLGVLAVAAIALGVLIWTQHRSDADELRYRTRVMQAAADWTSVLINMNKDNVDASLQKLHDGTVGQLNADFDSTVEPYRKLVQTLQSHTTGQVDSVAVESIHHAQPGPDGAPPPQPQPELSASCVAHRHRDGGGDVDQRERRRRQAADRALERFGSTSPTSTASC